MNSVVYAIAIAHWPQFWTQLAISRIWLAQGMALASFGTPPVGFCV